MRLLFGFLSLAALASASLPPLRSETPLRVQGAAVERLLRRLLPKQASQISVSLDKSLSEDTVEVSFDSGVLVRSGSGVSAAYGIARYLRLCCGAHFAWNGFSVASVPTVLPSLSGNLSLTAVGPYRYMSNVCTFSYSYVWWGWGEWEGFVDWLALSGVNFPLAHVGAEAVWREVWLRMGLSDRDLDGFFPGPAFLAWHRMGNLQAWAGPLSPQWHRGQIALQRRILQRMSELGMVPILPAFAGFVPRALKKRFPSASVYRSSDWPPFGGQAAFTGLDFLDPVDPLFKTIGNAYIRALDQTFGRVFHAYSADSFNEMAPRSFQPAYLANVSRAIFAGMSGADPKARWVMQAWLFLNYQTEWRANDSAAARALLGALPKGRLILLDLTSEALPQYQAYESFFGQTWLWNTLQDYGGNLELGGRVTAINQGISKGLAFPNSSMAGTGLTMEGIYNNYPVYQLTLDRSWAQGPIDLDAYIRAYAANRYGARDEKIGDAWSSIWKTIFDDRSQDSRALGRLGGSSRMSSNVHHPHTDFLFKRPGLGKAYYTWYNSSELWNAWKVFVERSKALRGSKFFLQDLVDISRQSMELVGLNYYHKLSSAYDQKSLPLLKSIGAKFLGWWEDLDALLSTNEHFLLGKWIKAARDKASTAADKDLFEFNARNQVTLWGPRGEILDYARKQWGGLSRAYYAPRWALFVRRLSDSLARGTKFNRTAYDDEVLRTVEEAFCASRAGFPSEPLGDPVRVAAATFAKYSRHFPRSMHPHRSL